MDITLKSNKEEIITSSLELVDSLSEENKNLKEDRKALIAISAILFCFIYLF